MSSYRVIDYQKKEFVDSCSVTESSYGMKKKKHKPQKLSVLWTVYHTVLAVELLIIIIIEGIELLR